MALSRRAVLGAAAAAAASVAAGCSRAARAPAGSSATTAAPGRTGARSASSTPTGAGATSGRAAASTGPAAPGGPAVQVTHGPRTRAEVALTFHGQGDPALVRELLGIVAGHGAHLTVLAVGTWLRQYPHIAGEIAAAGHDVGNHTYRHLDINSFSPAAARDEIVRCRDLLQHQLGGPGAFFRQSQSPTATPLVRRLAGAAGYRVCLSYDVDSLDWTDPGPAAVRRAVRAAGPGSIVSMHFGHPGTVSAMPHVLDDLAARGLRAVTATELLRP